MSFDFTGNNTENEDGGKQLEPKENQDKTIKFGDGQPGEEESSESENNDVNNVFNLLTMKDDASEVKEERQEQSENQVDPVKTLLSQTKVDSLIGDLDLDAIKSKIAEGDTDILFGTIAHVGEKAAAKAVEAVINIVPNIVEAAVTKATEQAKSLYKETSIWESFVQQYPAANKLENLIRPQLELAVNKGATPKAASEAMAKLFGSVLNAAKEREDKTKKSEANHSFSVTDFLKI